MDYKDNDFFDEFDGFEEFEDFSDDFIDFDIVDTDAMYSAMQKIYENYGFDKVLSKLALSTIDFISLYTQYKDKNFVNKKYLYNKMIKNLSMINTLIETLAIGNDDIYEEIEMTKENFIVEEFNNIETESESNNDKMETFNNRVIDFFDFKNNDEK